MKRISWSVCQLLRAGGIWACDDDGGVAGAADAGGPGAVIDERGGLVLADEGFGDGASRLVYLEQGWNPAETQWFYHADQGSTLLPRCVLLNLEQPTGQGRFLDPAYLVRFRFLNQRPGPGNVHGLPVGFAEHGDHIGLTCAACHTSQIEYGGVAVRIDGGAAALDMDGFLEALQAAMEATLADEAKLGRYLDDAAEGPPPGMDARRADAKAELEATVAWFQDYNRVNDSATKEGFARIDAVGRIVNQVIRLTSGSENSVEPNAPNSLPVLWDAPRHDYVQWSGFSTNAGIGSLARNAGEVVGVFGQVKVEAWQDELETLRPYFSSIEAQHLTDMEAQLWRLQSPVWPEDVLPPIDRALAERGAAIYQRECVDCHAIMDRADEARRVRAQVYGVDVIGTDPLAAVNFADAVIPTGLLEGSVTPEGGRFGPEAPASALLGTLVIRSLFAQPTALTAVSLYANRYGLEDQEKQGDFTPDSEGAPTASYKAYKARPLNGVWASAPYLHNGSVPSLYDLLLPVDQRPVTFKVGRWAFDPVKVGPSQDGDGPFVVDTR
ncbi:MAG: hypothetical protein KC549_08520, partial [Myxococcales bacterium]|nr:hypothetical protein [Myxococcales bacterium]